MSTRKHWLLAYDIREPRRLRRVHAYLRQRGIALQYSLFGLEEHDRSLRMVMDDLQALINCDVDDVRAYHLPAHCKVWTLGRQALPDGIELHAGAVMRLLQRKPGTTTSREPHFLLDPSASHCIESTSGAVQSKHLPR